HPRLPVTLLPAEGVNPIEQAHLSDQLTPTAKATEARPGRSRTNRWRKLWVRLAGPGRFGRCAARLAIRGTQPFHGRAPLARLHPQGFVAPSASLPTQGVTRGQHVYIGDGVVILRHLRGREIQID